jgi:hypothetical protein
LQVARSLSGGSLGDKNGMPTLNDKNNIKDKHMLVIGFVI